MTTPTSGSGKILLFSIATNGYDRHFAALLDKQRDFACAIGADYWVARQAPPRGISAHDSSWLKIPLLVWGLRRGYEWVLYLDADCEVLACPSPATAFADEPAAVFVCNDFSARINAAVIFVRNSLATRKTLRRLWWSSFVPARMLPAEDRNLYENGHLIHYLKNDSSVRIMEGRWNCSIYKEVADFFIFHHGGTPVRAAAVRERPSRGHGVRKKLAAVTTGFRLLWHCHYYLRQLPRPPAN